MDSPSYIVYSQRCISALDNRLPKKIKKIFFYVETLK